MRRLLNQRCAYSSSPQVRLDEQTIELPVDDRRKSRNPSVELGNDHLALIDLLGRKLDRIWMRFQLSSIFRERHRSPSLQRFQIEPLFPSGEANTERFSAL